MKIVNRWTPIEDKTLIDDHVAGVPFSVTLGKLPDRTEAAARLRAWSLGLRRRTGELSAGAQHITVVVSELLAERIDVRAKSLGKQRSTMARELLELGLDRADAGAGAAPLAKLTPLSRSYFVVEAQRRRVTVPVLLEWMIAAIAESELVQAVLDDSESAPATKRARP